jgi:hypothetical protein
MATPAFPRPFSLDTREAFDDSIAHPAHTGITIQDYFAAKAMQGAISGCAARGEVIMYSDLAALSYEMADAMIKARSEA